MRSEASSSFMEEIDTELALVLYIQIACPCNGPITIHLNKYQQSK